MSDFLRILFDAFAYIWPFRIVYQYERGCYYVCGRYWKTVGPGVYPVLPWFSQVIEASVAEVIVGTGRQDITLSDGTMLSFSATATVAVTDVRAALNDVDEYKETVQEALASVLADRLAEMDAKRLEYGARGRVLTTLRKAVSDEMDAYGVEVRKVRFTSFILNAKAHRLIIDQQQTAAW